jgi:ribonuclease HIII
MIALLISKEKSHDDHFVTINNYNDLAKCSIYDKDSKEMDSEQIEKLKRIIKNDDRYCVVFIENKNT